MTSTATKRVIVVGNGMAGSRFVSELATRAPRHFDVTVVGAEPRPAYNRILLSAVLAGERTFDDIGLDEGGDASTRLGERVTAIDLERRVIRTDRGAELGYDVLVLATGSNALILPVPGATLPGVVAFRDVDDVERMIAARGGATTAVVIGGGLLGLEAAEGLRRRGFAVTVVHLMPWLMERQLDAAAAALLRAMLEMRGLDFVLEASTAAILGTDWVEGVRLADGRTLAADLVVMAAGVRPDFSLAAAAGIACGRGILVDDALRTSDPAICAIGECAEHRGLNYGLLAPVWDQAQMLARRFAGELVSYEGSVLATSLKVSGIELFSAGCVVAETGAEEIVFEDPDAGIYRKLVLKDGRLAGTVLLGDASDGAWYADLMRRAADVSGMRRDLVFGRDFVSAGTAS
jgi:nitrite reductase (NADH) large subunit